ncbi:MAG: hypothetical protein Pg6B_10960 [Candidatus Azobacteroides pseudotrichonymphae]|nr:MAG: hypothetical protein Pg6B_10960 [Candidatus Azobacteroides pseudotrichonymphae]
MYSLVEFQNVAIDNKKQTKTYHYIDRKAVSKYTYC